MAVRDSLFMKLAKLPPVTPARKARVLAEMHANAPRIAALAAKMDKSPQTLAAFRALFDGEIGRIIDAHR
jgi:D-serine deaminase-like pyridoxal phosphate-dependent protein